MALLRISLLKLARRPATWVILVIMLGLNAMVFLGLAASAGQLTDPTDELQIRLFLSFPTAYTFLVGMILSLGGLLAVIYGAAIIGADWAWGTIRAIVARGESRVRYTLVTFAAIAVFIGLGILLTFVISAAMAIAGAEMAEVGSDGATDPDTLGSLPELLARTWLGVSEQAAIGFAIAMVFRSQLAGIGAGLAFFFGEMFLVVVPIVQDVLPYFPFSVANAVVSTSETLGDSGFGSASAIDSDTAIIWAVGYLVVALAIASLAAWRAQITQ